ncbi:hypothetical protein GCM10007052_32800 [Halioglobus japonicus]|nr:hypothetical protein [Halioglobus japonicus]GHD21695.1 hypothetical protein GCM10007052_32800 [Halioglobus japonicus]
MTQHLLEDDTQADRQALRTLGIIMIGFTIATIVLIVGVRMFVG